MRVSVARWGNSIGVRIPRDVARAAGLDEGAKVDISAEDGRVVISLARPRYDLATLLADMDPAALREAFEWGPEVGREIVE